LWGNPPSISVIVPTIGRPESLARLLASLAAQTHLLREVVVADGSADGRTAEVTGDPRWAAAGLAVRRDIVSPPHAVRQRQAAIAASSGELLLLLDDDVELEHRCVEEMVKALRAEPGAVAVMADFNNQTWAMPTRAWRLYLRLVHGMKDGEWQGRVIGPLLRYGFNPPPRETRRCDWLGAGNSLIRRAAFERAEEFSDFFLHRSTTNEDVDLGLRLSRIGTIVFCPQARMGHFHDSAGRVSLFHAAEDDLFNRFLVLHHTMGHSKLRALGLVGVFMLVESTSNLAGSVLHGRWGQTGRLMCGRMSGLYRISRSPGRHGTGRTKSRTLAS
jgi:GT2 family glycosyltransferase